MSTNKSKGSSAGQAALSVKHTRTSAAEQSVPGIPDEEWHDMVRRGLEPPSMPQSFFRWKQLCFEHNERMRAVQEQYGDCGQEYYYQRLLIHQGEDLLVLPRDQGKFPGARWSIGAPRRQRSARSIGPRPLRATPTC